MVHNFTFGGCFRTISRGLAPGHRREGFAWKVNWVVSPTVYFCAMYSTMCAPASPVGK